uniref:NADH-ubiquinone oxidoreductase chain 4L n=1 Tax=Pimpla luctuosa TaxID=495389 RepID=A0A3Q8UA83_9HYME|nr:NADH dehydrogenase subunit 4L [Pimpla luctuosa]
MLFDYILSLYMFMITCFMFSYYYKHLMLTIISLEFIMISVFFNMFIILMVLESNLYLMIVFLTMGVCEGALGLSLIVLIVRFYGNDYMNSMSLMKW